MSEMENQTIVEDNAAVLDEEFDETTSSSEEQQQIQRNVCLRY